MRAFGVLSVLAEVCYNIGYSHNAALKRCGNQFANVLFIRKACFNLHVKLGKAIKRLRVILRKLHFAVVRGNSVKGLQSNIIRENFIKHPYRLNIVAEMPARVSKQQLVKKLIALVTERRVTYIVTERDRLDQIKIKA